MGTASASVIRKSFFAPCNLTKGIFIDSPVNFNHVRAFHHNAPLQFVARTAQAGSIAHARYTVAASGHGPVGVEKQVWPGYGAIPLRAVVSRKRGRWSPPARSALRTGAARYGERR